MLQLLGPELFWRFGGHGSKRLRTPVLVQNSTEQALIRHSKQSGTRKQPENDYFLNI